MKILVMSCDNNADLWEPLHHFLEKYWPDHPEIYVLTDTLDCPYYKTIKINKPINQWSRRVHDAAAQIDDDLIMIMPEDLFIYDTVNTKMLYDLVNIIDDNTGSLNLHHRFSVKEQVINTFIQKRPHGAKYNCSVMCSVWNKKNMLRVFNVDYNPWDFERHVNDLGLDYYVYNNSLDFFKFREPTSFLFGLWRGQWSEHCVNLFEKEGIKMDYSKRGIFHD